VACLPLFSFFGALFQCILSPEWDSKEAIIRMLFLSLVCLSFQVFEILFHVAPIFSHTRKVEQKRTHMLKASVNERNGKGKYEQAYTNLSHLNLTLIEPSRRQSQSMGHNPVIRSLANTFYNQGENNIQTRFDLKIHSLRTGRRWRECLKRTLRSLSTVLREMTPLNS
jgi:hypothetical protein